MGTKARNYGEVQTALENLDTFTHPSMSGEWYPAGYDGDMGKLDPDEIARMRQHVSKTEPVYVVKSYWTPIAWWQGDKWHVVQQRFSVTTSQQQGKVAVAWSKREGM